MQDFKNELSAKWKNAEKGLSLTRTHQQKSKIKYKIFNQNLMHGLIAAGIILVSCTVFIFSVKFVFAGTKKTEVLNPSFIGDQKMKEEFTSMSGADGAGGEDLKAYVSNKNELNFFFYKIKQGESLSTLSKKLGVSMDTLISLNSMDNAHALGEGRRIIVPSLQGILYTVKKDDTIETIASKYKINQQEIADANELDDMTLDEGNMIFIPGAQLTDTERAKALGYYFNKPIHGHLTSTFGLRQDPFSGELGYHPGIDIAAPIGSPVYSSKEGKVVFTGWNGGYGKCIIIKHQFGYETVYGHLSSIGVKKDAVIKAGQYIGRVGSTGYSTGAHLHFEIRKYGRPTNPTRLAGLAKSGSRWY